VSPKVSIVVTCYNYGRYVTEAVDSLLNQTFRDIEVIVIDDASPDGSAQVLERYDGDPRVRLVLHEQNRGHIASYNEGLGMARGEYLGVMGADDFANRPYALERQVALFEEHPRVGCVYSSYQIVDATGRETEVARPWEEDYVVSGLEEFQRLVWINYISHSGTLVRRACHDALGWYDARLPHSGDYDLWLRVATQFDMAYVAEPLYAYRVHDTNMSHTTVGPSQAMDELLLTLDRNFTILPTTNGGVEARALWGPARRHALFAVLWNDLAHGRTWRSWQGLFAALKRSPRLAVDRAYAGAAVRVLALTALGGARYRKTFGGFAK
jgi:hypothetical protein